MKIKQLKIEGSWIGTPVVHSDSRGDFFEWFQDSNFDQSVGHQFKLAQANFSRSKKGVVRGIHFAMLPPGQGKYVTCFTGSVFDVLVDLRIGSPTFGTWESVLLNSQVPTVVYIPSGIGHGFMALEDNSIFVYLCDERYNPKNELEIMPLDKTLNIQWPLGVDQIISDKDRAAKSFEELYEFFPKYQN